MYGYARVRLAVRVALLVAASSVATVSFAAEKSGIAVGVTQSATAAGPAGDRNLFATAPVFLGDSVVTNRDGEAQIRLLDDTRLVVGPNSSIVIDQFVFSGKGQAGAVSIDAVRGAFRFITGVSQKDAYSIKTPMATIGVRGTRFDFTVSRLRLNFALYEGEATICNRLRECFVVKGPCAMVEARRFRPTRPIASSDERERLVERGTFPYLAQQARLQRNFRVDTSSCHIAPADIRAGGVGPINGPTRAFGSGGITSGGAGAVAGGAAGDAGHNNNGLGNGGEGGEGANETGNPGGGGGNGGGGGKP
jgi:hypothetical protein